MASELGLTSPNYAKGCPENFTVISFWLELIDFQYLFTEGGKWFLLKIYRIIILPSYAGFFPAEIHLKSKLLPELQFVQ